MLFRTFTSQAQELSQKWKFCNFLWFKCWNISTVKNFVLVFSQISLCYNPWQLPPLLLCTSKSLASSPLQPLGHGRVLNQSGLPHLSSCHCPSCWPTTAPWGLPSLPVLLPESQTGCSAPVVSQWARVEGNSQARQTSKNWLLFLQEPSGWHIGCGVHQDSHLPRWRNVTPTPA